MLYALSLENPFAKVHQKIYEELFVNILFSLVFKSSSPKTLTDHLLLVLIIFDKELG